MASSKIVSVLDIYFGILWEFRKWSVQRIERVLTGNSSCTFRHCSSLSPSPLLWPQLCQPQPMLQHYLVQLWPPSDQQPTPLPNNWKVVKTRKTWRHRNRSDTDTTEATQATTVAPCTRDTHTLDLTTVDTTHHTATTHTADSEDSTDLTTINYFTPSSICTKIYTK